MAIVRAGCCLAFAVLVGVAPFATETYLTRILTFVGLNVIVVTGLALLFGYAGQISLGHAAFFGIGAYTSAYLTVTAGWPWPVALACAVALSALGGALLAIPSLKLKGHYLAMATLGFGEIMSIAFREGDAVTGGFDGFTGIGPIALGGIVFRSPESMYWLVWAVAGVALLLSWNVVSLRPGRAMRALHGSELGAMACGIDTVRLKVQVFVLSAVLAGVSGVLYAHAVRFISPKPFNLEFSVLLVAMAVLGGTGSLVGPLSATVLLTLVPYVGAIAPGLPKEVASTIKDWAPDIYGLVIIVVMLFAPGGVAGVFRRAGAWLRPLTSAPSKERA